MTKIIKSLSVIAFVAAIALAGTGAYFSDTETSTNNIMQAGSLDLILNGVNGDPVNAIVEIEDMKPCQVRYSAPIKLHITDNPGRIYKKISIDGADCETVTTTEPECTVEGGTWDGTACSGASGQGTGYQVSNDLFPVTYFDLAIWRGLADTAPTSQDTDGSDSICVEAVDIDCWETLIPDGVITVSNIANKQIYLGGEDGSYGAENAIVIRQSFHMDENADNRFQTDRCGFTEEFTVVQTNNPMTGENICIPDPSPAGNGCQS